VMKVDVEGHEPNVLRGASECIARDRPPILYEYNHGVATTIHWTPDDIAALLNRLTPYRFHLLEGRALAELPSPPERAGGVINIYGAPC